ncbi:MAG: hypothetical protein U9P90_04685 [Patescibacteria group bacterium]|nr:hypothetical protein [Patescibacteria group bacterium]
MTYKQYLIVMSFATALSWVAWFFVLFFIDPFSANWMGLLFFYLSLYLAICGTLAILGLIFRIYLSKDKIVSRQAGIAFRQSILFATLPVGCLLLQSRELFTWWNSVLFITALTFVEFFFISMRRK